MDNHVKDLVSLDFIVVPTVTFRVLFVLVILAHDRRRVVHFNVTEPDRIAIDRRVSHAAWLDAGEMGDLFPGGFMQWR